MNGKLGTIAVLVVFCLLFGAIGGGLTAVIVNKPIQGERGLIGLPGLDGKDGINGTDGKDGVNGTDGKDGSRGPRGYTGPPGKDCECNEQPIVTFNTSDSYVCGKNFHFKINFSVYDPEEDTRIINLYHKHHINEPWIRTNAIGGNPNGYIQHWYSKNNSDYFTEEHLINYSPAICEEIWWLIEVDDGSNIVIYEAYHRLCRT